MPQTPRPPPPPLSDDIALFLDVDGALLPFAAAPDGVAASPALKARLGELQARLDGAIALVSGRRLADLDRLFAPLSLASAGLHGLERRGRDGEVAQARDAAQALDRVRAAAQVIAARYDGAVVEDKGVALAFHWRAAPLAASDFQALAATAAMELPDYHLQPGDHVAELRPAGADKGTAIAAFLAEPPFAGRMPVFVGDDLTDEHGFEAVNLRGGRSVLVGTREPSAATFGLADVAAVHRWLGVAGEPAA